MIEQANTTYNTASQNMRGFGSFLTFLIIFKLYNGGLERWAENPHVSNAETVIQHFMKTIATIIFVLFLFSVSAQETDKKSTVSNRKAECSFETQGEQEDDWSKHAFDKNYKKQTFNRFNGEILIVNENTIKYDEEVLLVYETSEDLKIIFKKGIFYPEIITGPVKKGLERKEELDLMLFRNDSLRITNFEELTFLNTSDKVKRFRFYLFTKGFMNPTIYYIELTNDSATKETDLATFINGAILTFFEKGSLII